MMILIINIAVERSSVDVEWRRRMQIQLCIKLVPFEFKHINLAIEFHSACSSCLAAKRPTIVQHLCN